MSVRDLGADTAAALKAFLSSKQVQQPAGCQLIAYSATPALKQWLAENQVRTCLPALQGPSPAQGESRSRSRHRQPAACTQCGAGSVHPHAADACCCMRCCAHAQLAMPLLLDDVRLGHKGLMHRQIKHLDRPSKVRGACTDELLVAAPACSKALGASPCICSAATSCAD